MFAIFAKYLYTYTSNLERLYIVSAFSRALLLVQSFVHTARVSAIAQNWRIKPHPLPVTPILPLLFCMPRMRLAPVKRNGQWPPSTPGSMFSQSFMYVSISYRLYSQWLHHGLNVCVQQAYSKLMLYTVLWSSFWCHSVTIY